MLPTVHTFARFEQAKKQFKQQMCLNVDTLFNIFVTELNSNPQLTIFSNSITANDATVLPLISNTVEFQNSSNNAVAQQQKQCLNSNECLTDPDQLARIRSTDDQQQKVPLVPDNERTHEADSAEQTLYENDLFNFYLPDQAQQNDQNVIQTTNPLVKNNFKKQSTHFTVKQEIADDDEFDEAQYYNNIYDYTNWEESVHGDDQFRDENSQEYVHGSQWDTCQAGITNHEACHYPTNEQETSHQSHNSFDKSHAFAAYSHMNDDDEIYDEELLREVKEEILEEERSKAKKQKIDSTKCAQIDAAQVYISTEDPSTDNVDRIINSNSTCTIGTSTQPTSTSLTLPTSQISTDSPVQPNYEQNEIINSQIEQNADTSKALEDGELIDSDEDEHFTEFDIVEKRINNNNKRHYKECHYEVMDSFISLLGENTVPDMSNISRLLANHNLSSFDYDKFRVISQKCSSCNLFFGTKEILTCHMLQVHNLLPFQCPFSICAISKLSFASINELTEHFQHKDHSHSRIICNHCNQKCSSPMALFTHKIDCHSRGEFACVKNNCDHVARFRVMAIKHYKKEHLPIDNQIRAKVFLMIKRQAEIVRKCLRVTNQPGLRPESPKRKKSSVDKEANSQPNLDKTKFTVISVKCTEKGCHSEFAQIWELVHHHKIEHNILCYVCPIERCGMSFASRSALTHHAEVVHRDMAIFNCYKCEFFTHSFDIFHKHNFMNHHEGKFRCGNDQCDYVGKFRNDTIKHYIYNHGHRM